MRSEELIVNVSSVSRWFGDVQALTNLTIEVPKGSITVLLGPNGAGKTTAIRMITGALEPNQGSVNVFGLDPGSNDGETVRRRCGVVSAKPSLYDRLNGWDNLRYAAELYDIGRGPKADKVIADAAEKFGIAQALDQEVGAYSTGMKTRLALARSILHDPQLLLLDEPTSGLDPESAVAVLELIREMTGEGRTVLMCTHLLLEAEGLADEVVVMQHGTSLVWGPPADLADRFMPEKTVRISAVDGATLDSLDQMHGVNSYDRSGDSASVDVSSFELVPDLVSQLVASGAQLTSVTPFVPSLEDIYFAVRRQNGTTESELPRTPFLDRSPDSSQPRRRTGPLNTRPNRKHRTMSAANRTSLNFSRIWTVARTDLKQLAQAKDFWMPMTLLGSFFFVLIPLILLTSITKIGSVEAVDRISETLKVLPKAAQEQLPADASDEGKTAYALAVFPVCSRGRHRAPDHLDRGWRRHHRGRTRAGHGRIPGSLPSRREGDLPRQAAGESHPRLLHHGHRLSAPIRSS